jgi:hypothetical protein
LAITYQKVELPVGVFRLQRSLVHLRQPEYFLVLELDPPDLQEQKVFGLFEGYSPFRVNLTALLDQE